MIVATWNTFGSVIKWEDGSFFSAAEKRNHERRIPRMNNMALTHYLFLREEAEGF